MNESKPILAGTVFDYNGDIFVVSSFKNSTVAFARNLKTNDVSETPVSCITKILPAVGGQAAAIEEFVNSEGEMRDEWREVAEIALVIQPLVFKPQRSTKDVAEVAAKLDISVTTAYRYIKQIEESGRILSLLRASRSDAGKPRLEARVEKAINFIIESEWKASQKRSQTGAYEKLKSYCRKKKIPLPGLSTFKRRLAGLSTPLTEIVRQGNPNADLAHRLSKGSISGADLPYSVIQIDHTLVDIEILDTKDRSPIGRPWITVAIDTCTRMTVGWYISFDPPGALATGIAIANMILPKRPQMIQLGVDYEWLCQGLPGVIHTDNAREFTGRMLELACMNIGFRLKNRALKKPQHGAHIERYQGSLMKWIHGLEGTTFSNPQKRGSYRSAEKATMVLDEFEAWFANLVLGKYHHAEHSGLDNRAPVDVYRDYILGSDEIPGIGISPVPTDEIRLRLDFLPPILRTIQTDGVEVVAAYSDPVLDRWVNARDPKNSRSKRKFIFRRDPRNISKLFFFDPELETYFEIPYANRARPPVSLWRFNAARRWLHKTRGIAYKDMNEEMSFKALDAMEQIEATAKRKTRQVRREAERAQRHKKSMVSETAAARKSPVAAPVESDEEDLPAFGDVKPSSEVDF